MAMKRKLLVVATLAWFAPLSAHQAAATARHYKSHCPLERKESAVQAWTPIAAPAAAPAPAKKAIPAVVVVQGSPAAASALGLARSPVFMP